MNIAKNSVRCLWLVAFLVMAAGAQAAEKSLYDPKAAQKIDPSKLSILGPKPPSSATTSG
jgi:hypothetical protein